VDECKPLVMGLRYVSILQFLSVFVILVGRCRLTPSNPR